ncbi:ATP-binding cassette sub-family B member 6, mitochondrial [Aplysia californica]|uniref:ATP-binding cassette sub-family B member 6 n=1 Tax=Aplysia californica TaxID=6500 RepID=A0ABM1A0B6_APLCA|nr:ATP-binding cassette sub-family B member 6, mitochondrial [Aplysia californica]XP_035825788.1 ATP-binding cassette sub-family B member 6, mitochondrial [Aplysia californica]XP_035825789.1 ATP-binding cassette sub-family B member 6, mitochondrial [Aplysia californica]XP_035825790.1 ATP-binding cassette sub-family B member 6, mitochondrial [Aplysia californica]
MLFCENGTEWSHVWVEKGISRCFYESTSSGILLIFICLTGAIQCTVFSKYAVYIDPRRVLKSWGYVVQVLLTMLLMLEALVHMVLFDVYLRERILLGYQVFEACALIMACIVSLWLLALEKRSMLPTTPSRGQGIVLLMFWGLFLIRETLFFVSWNDPAWWWQLETQYDEVEFGLFILRFVLVLCLLILGFVGPSVQRSIFTALSSDEESQSSNNSQQNHSTWKNVMSKMKLMLPYVWPKGSPLLQVTVFLCLILLGAGRVVNVFVPIYSKLIVNSLTYDKESEQTSLEWRWDYILTFAALTFLKGGGTGTTGLLNNVRSLLWIKVQQFTTRSIQIKLFSHLHSLSLRWHLGRKTGEVLRVIDRGTNSINSLLNYLVFQIFPTIADIIIAIVYFVTFFNYLFGIIVFISMAFYLAATFIVTEWRTKYRRLMNLKDNEANAKAVDSLLNFETVKYYGASDWEKERYTGAVLEYQSFEWKSTASLNLLNLAQNFVNSVGLAAGSLLCAWAVVHSINDLKLTVGDYVLFGTYLAQLYVPLNWLGTYYRMIQQSFIDMENMFDLLGQDVEIQDDPDSSDLVLSGGEIQFKNVSFHYEPSKAILKNVSFTVPSGQTYALVGHTGSGKSTIVRLLFRFYDVQSGCIKIDGQDITKVTQKSLRDSIGVVPQDTVLFNSDIRYNIRYGRVGASDVDVEEAAQAAEIHDRILTFPRQYETVVGERGLKLSGGEKQRVAIARTLLKAPAIVLLDEATSALDTKTERNIQSSLARVCENRTTIIVAHRLSTIIHAHQIIVLNEGEILESGTHQELLDHGGHYADMWQQQRVQQQLGEEESVTPPDTDKDSQEHADGNGNVTV